MGKKKNKPLPPPLPAGVTLVDTHCHLDMAELGEEVEQVIARARAQGVTRMITIGVDLPSSRAAVALAEAYEGLFAAVGVCPHTVTGLASRDLEELQSLAARPEVVAYGEIGLDFVKRYCPPAEQLKHFVRQVELARDLGLPIIIHDREAHAEVMAVLGRAAPFPAGGVMHCFSGDLALARAAMELGFLISVPGVITFDKAETLQEVAREVPIEALVLETDAPYLAPAPWRGRRNEPAYLIATAHKVAELRQMEAAELARAVTANARRLFRLPEEDRQ